MFQTQADNGESNFRKMGFSDKVWRCLKRAELVDVTLGSTDKQAMSRLLRKARSTIDIADNAVIERLLAKNRHIIQFVEPSLNGELPEGLLAILPLNDVGYDILVDGHFDGRAPLVEWICAPGEQPAALYIWLVFMPLTFGRLLAAIANAIDPMVDEPCPMFSRATNDHSAKLHRSAGFKGANEFFPNCKDDLLVTFPEAPLSKPSPLRTEIAVARTVEDIFKVFSVRSATYLAEQFCLYREEFDGNDFCATHFLGTVNGDAAGCVRLRFFDGFAKLERLAVRTEYRQSRLAYQLVRAALNHCSQKGYTRVIGHSRLDLVRFWRVFGFKPVASRPTFSFANVQYVEILREQAPDANSIRFDVDPMIIIRPEGAWNVLGPFEQPPQPMDKQRKRLLVENTRTIRRQTIIA
jgi:predicted GNAT family N-acyltransferase